jgi:hypothetical protein
VIWYALVNYVLAPLITFIAGAFPTSTLVPNDFSAIGTLFAYAKAFDAHVPVHEEIEAVGIVLTALGFLLAWKIGRWVFSHVPFVGGD